MPRSAQALGHGDRGAQAIAVERRGPAVLRFGRGLVAGQLIDLRLDDQSRRFGALTRGGLQACQIGASRREILLAGLQPGHHILTQRAELVLGADAAQLPLGTAIVALFDRLDGQHQVGETIPGRVARTAGASCAA